MILWMSVVGFNLIRSLMQRAAAQGEEGAWHLSFKGVPDPVVASHEKIRAHTGQPRKRAGHSLA